MEKSTTVKAVEVPLVLFGLGIGNTTSLPPLIAQKEFVPAETARVVPLIVAIAQAGYAFAPAAFGLLRGRDLVDAMGSAPIFFCAGVVQLAAIGCLLAGRRQNRGKQHQG